MKRIGDLFERIYQRDNLGAALWAASRGKRTSVESTDFRRHSEQQLNEISRQLRTGQYVFSGYRRFAVKDTKSRVIHAPPFRDRVVHHAIIRVLGAAFLQSVIPHSYACIKGRGQHRALHQLTHWLRRHHWYGKVDVRKFYDSVDQQILLQLLARRFRERQVLTLFESLLNSWSSAPGKGIPIGALTSQWLGNFYLDEIDRGMMAAGVVPHYLRYMDDMLLLGTKPQVMAAKPLLLERLQRLSLSAKHGGEWNQASQGIPWLGFTVYPNRVRLCVNGRRRLRRKLNNLRQGLQAQKVDEYGYQRRCESLIAHAQHSDDINWRRAMLASTDVDG